MRDLLKKQKHKNSEVIIEDTKDEQMFNVSMEVKNPDDIKVTMSPSQILVIMAERIAVLRFCTIMNILLTMVMLLGFMYWIVHHK